MVAAGFDLLSVMNAILSKFSDITSIRQQLISDGESVMKLCTGCAYGVTMLIRVQLPQ